MTSLLQPEATPTLSAIQLVSGLRASRFLARILLALFATMLLALVFVPWQQNIVGAGRVVAFEPYNRRQVIAAPVGGRVKEVWVSEGSRVRAGDRLLEIVDNDPDIVVRLEQQRASLMAQFEASQAKASAYQAQIDALQDTRSLAVTGAESQVEVAVAKVEAVRHALDAALAAAHQARLNFDRQRALFEEGLASQLEFEVAERSFKEARARAEQERQALGGAENDLRAKRADLGRTGAEAKARIDAAAAQKQAADVEAAVKQQKLSELGVRIAQQNTQLVTAPRDGIVFRLQASPGAELVKAGDPLAILVPDGESRAVELWLDGNDVPLLERDRTVRLQFEGWPAVQFSGWPSVAVGTFGGRVELVDSSDDGRGKFRIVVLPDPADEPWPSSKYLRQGTRANGFVLLDQVRLGYELWRQANGFPPTVAMQDGAATPGGKP